MRHTHTHSAAGRRAGTLALATTLILLGSALTAAPAHAVTTGNGSLVYAPPDGSSFNDEGGDATGTAYAKIVALKHSGSANGTLVVTFDDGRLIKDVSPSSNPTTDTQACLATPSLPCHQEWPIFRSSDGGASWTKIAAVNPGLQFPGIPGQEDLTQLDRLAQPFLTNFPKPPAVSPPAPCCSRARSAPQTATTRPRSPNWSSTRAPTKGRTGPI